MRSSTATPAARRSSPPAITRRRDNGFKYKPEYAGSASPAVVAKLEAQLEATPVKRIDLATAERQGLVERFDARPAYLQQLAMLADIELIKRAGKTIIVDSMFGAGAGYLPALLDGGATRVIPINAERNPIFPGIRAPEPIDGNLAKLKKVVKESGADVGIAFDGDADRVGLVDEKGRFINQLQVFGLLTYYLLEVKGWRGPIVKSLSTTSMVNRLGELYGVPVYETPVGFKHIGPKMIETNAIIGGEESGGFAFDRHIPERDGILAALFLLELILKRNKPPSQILEELFCEGRSAFLRPPRPDLSGGNAPDDLAACRRRPPRYPGWAARQGYLHQRRL